MRWLTKEEQEAFREDYRETEREIQKYIGVYLSGLVLVTSWVIGPQSKSVIEMALGNGGYNVLGLLLLVVLNILFINFLIYKSIIVHEITQFMAYLSGPDSGFNYWESWRRSPQSATRPVRVLYTFLLSVLPLIVSILIMLGLGLLLFKADPVDLARQLNEAKTSAVATPPAAAGTPAAPPALITPEQLASAFALERKVYWFVLAAHIIPFIFFYHNVHPTNKRWKVIKGLRGSDESFRELSRDAPAPQPPAGAGAVKMQIYDAATGEPLGEITEEQRQVLSDHHPEALAAGSTYYLDGRTLEMFEGVNADPALLSLMRKILKGKEAVEVRIGGE